MTLLTLFKITRLQALLDEKLAELRHEEYSLRTNMQKWVLLIGMNDHIKTQIPEIKGAIDLFSASAQNLLNASSLVVNQDVYCVQVQARMNANYRRTCEIFEEAQSVLDQLQLIDEDYKTFAIVHASQALEVSTTHSSTRSLSSRTRSRPRWSLRVISPCMGSCPSQNERQLQENLRDF